MCYSAQIWSDYRKYVRAYGADIDITTFTELFWSRLDNDKIKVPLALENAFNAPQGDQETHISGLIDRYRLQQAAKLEQELFKQRQRLADAERTLLAKTTKAALEAKRISSSKVEWAMAKLADLRRTDMRDSDSRIYPGYYAPVLIVEDGRRVVKPMRYQCRPAGKPSTNDSKFPGTYNARRDNLEGFWKGQFGHTHGLMVVNAFYEHVAIPKKSGTGATVADEVEKVILEFKPQPQQDMLVACLWSRWTGAGEPDLLSFAAITDEPPSEVAAAGHDRCIVPIKPEHVDAWLHPDSASLNALYAILDDRERPYYEHRLAA
jgi:putative SOS response-associated peptidase YedK